MRDAAAAVRRLARLRDRFGTGVAEDKARLLRQALAARLSGARLIETLHDSLVFLRAYPDDAEVLRLAGAGCVGFHARADVRRERDGLINSGIAGTPVAYRFYWPTARWLASHWPRRLRVDWDELDDDEPLRKVLPLLMPYTESAALYEEDRDARGWIGLLKGPRETDATFLVRRFEALGLADRTTEKIWDELDLPFVLAPSATTPNRTTPFVPGFAPRFLDRPRSRARPDLAMEIVRPPRSVRAVSASRGRVLLDMARTTMITRDRDLDAIAFGNPADVLLVDDGDGVQFVAIGTLPERRYLLEGTYVFLVLRNGVPVGYMQGSGLFGWAEINFNVFPPWRGAEAGLLYGRSVALLHHLMGIRTFLVEPFQLGIGNEEALRSGAWWFYAKVGFRPTQPAVDRLARAEMRKARARPAYRTSLATLERLAGSPMRLAIGDRRPSVFRYGMVGKVGLKLSAYLAAHWGADREAGLDACAERAAFLLGGNEDPRRGMTTSEREAWRRWSPLMVALPGMQRWPEASRRALAAVARAKGGRRETEYLRRVAEHDRLAEALVRLVRTPVSRLPQPR